MKNRLHRALRLAKNTYHSYDSVADAALHESMQRLPWVVASAVIALCIGAVVNWGAEGARTPPALLGLHLASGIDLVLAVWAVTAALIPRLFRSCGRMRQFALLLLCAGLLLGMGLRSVVDQWGTASVTMYVLGCAFVGTVFLLHPVHATVLYLGGYVIFHYAIALTQPDGAVLNINRAQGFGGASMGLTLSILLWRKHMQMTLLQRILEASNSTLQQQQLKLEYLSQRDPLTGLFNRLQFDRLADLELQRAVQSGASLSLIMSDLDSFKQINDTYGHPVGDKAIQHAAQILQQTARDSDIVARIGGEEFVVLLPGATLHVAATIAERMRIAIEQSAVKADPELAIFVTSSFGVAQLDTAHSPSITDLYHAADRALYAAKRNGRNRVEMSL